jgi:hypothetical protein
MQSCHPAPSERGAGWRAPRRRRNGIGLLRASELLPTLRVLVWKTDPNDENATMSTQYQETKKPRILIIGSTGRIGSRVLAEIAKVDTLEAVRRAGSSKSTLGTRTARMLCSSTSTGLKLSGRLLPE